MCPSGCETNLVRYDGGRPVVLYSTVGHSQHPELDGLASNAGWSGTSQTIDGRWPDGADITLNGATYPQQAVAGCGSGAWSSAGQCRVLPLPCSPSAAGRVTRGCQPHLIEAQPSISKQTHPGPVIKRVVLSVPYLQTAFLARPPSSSSLRAQFPIQQCHTPGWWTDPNCPFARMDVCAGQPSKPPLPERR